MGAKLTGLVLAAAMLAVPAAAQNLRMGVGAQVTSIDPHFHNISPNNAFASMVYGYLLENDASSRLIPGIAESWKPIGENMWEFKLRSGVVFHDGTPFTADDVAFTVERIPTVVNSPGSFATYTQSIVKVEVVDPQTIRFHTRGPDPLLPVSLAQVPLLSRKIHTGATTEMFNTGQVAIGTGPFKVVSARVGERAELERFDRFWGQKPAWAKVDYRMITNDAARTAALLAGDLDFIDQVSTSDIERLRKSDRLRLSEIDSLRLVYFFVDHLRTGSSPFITDNDGKLLDRNPLKDLRVRKALSLAIDREAIVKQIMEGVAAPTNQLMPKGAFGYVPDIAVPAVDRDGARKLLAEAGYPNGFRITLHGSNDRYPNDGRITQAVGQMWTRVGVRTAVEVAPYASFIGRASRQEFSAFLVSWGSSTGEPSSGLRSMLATFDRERGLGSVNRARYSNPEFDAKLMAASRILDDRKREEELQEVTRMAINDVAFIPTHLQVNVWAMQKTFEHQPRADERSRAQDVRPAR